MLASNIRVKKKFNFDYIEHGMDVGTSSSILETVDHLGIFTHNSLYSDHRI